MKGMLRKKRIEEFTSEGLLGSKHLKRCLSALDLTLLGIGAVIGAGIFILTGIAAATQAGPAIILSFIISGLACAFSALSYAELASAIGGCGSVYGYAYVGFGEIFAWIIGWDLMLEYAVACGAVAIGWSAYFNKVLTLFKLQIPQQFLTSPLAGGILDLPAFLIMMAVTLLLVFGLKNSARVNATIVGVKLVAIAIFIAVASPHVNFNHWIPFMPFGWNGVMAGAGMVFFAYIGFDAVCTAAEEAIDPKRDLPKGIIASLIICTSIYVLVAALLTLVVPYGSLNTASPVSDVLIRLGHGLAGSLIAVGALAGLTTVMLVMFYGMSRITYAMARDKLLPKFLTGVHPKYHTPARILLFAGVLIAGVAATLPIKDIAELVNIGTLFAFVMVNSGVIMLRYSQPNMVRPFRTPCGILLPCLGIVFCIYLMISLSSITWMRFIIWFVLGMIFYLVNVSRRK